MGNPNNVSVRNLAQLWENVSKAEGGGGGIALDGAADRNNTECVTYFTSSTFETVVIPQNYVIYFPTTC